MASARPLIDKAAHAAQSAALLLDHGDIDGACNRAYYAMFDAARAALFAIGLERSGTRTHAGLIANFGLRLVKPGLVDASLGRMLNRAHEIRLIADYTGDLVEPQQAEWVITAAATFVDAMRRFTTTRASEDSQ